MEMSAKEVIINDVIYVPKEAQKLVSKDYFIVRTVSAGVFAGIILKRKGDRVVMTNARRLWHWKGAASLSQLAMEGVKYPEKCKFPCTVSHVELFGVIEILACHENAIKSIEGVPVWES